MEGKTQIIIVTQIIIGVFTQIIITTQIIIRVFTQIIIVTQIIIGVFTQIIIVTQIIILRSGDFCSNTYHNNSHFVVTHTIIIHIP